jgi:hypothetical protein
MERFSARSTKARAAFEFLKLFDHLVGQDPRVRENPKAREKTEERVTGWVERALVHGWSVRRVEEQSIEANAGRLVVHGARLGGLDTAATRALLAQVAAFLGLDCEALEARCRTRRSLTEKFQDIADSAQRGECPGKTSEL